MSANNQPLSITELFTIGIGPSSSHTVGPMKAAGHFINQLQGEGTLEQTNQISVTLFGSLALTGKGHGTDKAVILGLMGEKPDTVDTTKTNKRLSQLSDDNKLHLADNHVIRFDESSDIIFEHAIFRDEHPNALTLKAMADDGEVLMEQTYFSIGGGFIQTEDEFISADKPSDTVKEAIAFSSGEDLLLQSNAHNLSIADIMRENEALSHTQTELSEFLTAIHQAMNNAIEHGCQAEGELPGGLGIKRRARDLHRELMARPENALKDPLTVLDWVNLFALAVSEENACGGKIVTAPTNGAAGVIPAVLAYFERFCPGTNKTLIEDFLLTAGAIGMLYKKRASISGAEVGCQGEIGVACSMAAAGLTAALSGTAEQVENAAEIAMEHNLGLTCDPVGGLVQVPCIERNAMGAIKAINAARLALRGDGQHMVSLDHVIETMWQTGQDMQSKYKETSTGGLAVNVVEC